MFFKVTLLKVASLALIGYVAYLVINYIIKKDNSLDNWGSVAAFGLLFISVTGLVVDWLLIKFIPNYWIVQGIEAGILGIILFIDFYPKPSQTIIIPDEFKGYVSIVYKVAGEPPLYKYKYPFKINYKVELPSNGVVFTSSRYLLSKVRTKFRTQSGIFLNKYNNLRKLHAVIYDEGFYKCGQEQWYFKTWLISQKNSWNKSVDIDFVTPKALEEFCQNKRLLQKIK
ncbi:hypothetical protein BKI52_20420 [marine bacterium AO1-C]|nr:hypothetical protein BKI52_20420 [marine bacterium AO1-C]